MMHDRRSASGKAVLAGLISLLLLSSATAQAQEGFDTQRLNPIPGRRLNDFGVASALILDQWVWDVGLFVNYADELPYFCDEVLPRLKPGVIVHVHDIFLPFEYRRDWVLDEFRFWNEQYLLQAFLTFNPEFEVLLANYHLSEFHQEQLKAVFPDLARWVGGSFWMRRHVSALLARSSSRYRARTSEKMFHESESATMSAPRKLSIPLIGMATPGLSALVYITVATALAVSWKPLTKSNERATAMMATTVKLISTSPLSTRPRSPRLHTCRCRPPSDPGGPST